MGLQTLELRIEQSLATITLNRPQALNAINLTMVGELEQAVRQIRDDSNVRVVMITGAGDKAFAAGADITEFKAMSPIDAWTFVQRLQRLFLLMVEVRKLADKLAMKGPLAVRAAKEAIEDGYDMALERALAHEAQLFALCFATEDKAEGVNAFLEKRLPNFKGK